MGKNNLEKLVEVIWVDASSGTIDADKKDTFNIQNYLIERRSYGKIYKEDKNCIVLINTDDKIQMEYTAIPNVWIKQINYYKRE